MNSVCIKFLAVILMTIDHIGVFLYPENEIFRIVGRLAFPLFAFTLVRTAHNIYYCRIKEKIKNLLYLAIITHFVFAIFKVPMDHLNIYFTLVAGLIVILDEKYLWIIVLLSMIFNLDYAVYGIFLIYYINKYLERSETNRDNFKWIIILLNLFYYGLSIRFLVANLILLIIRLYDNEKPKKMYKNFFYWYYVIHILVLSILSKILVV